MIVAMKLLPRGPMRWRHHRAQRRPLAVQPSLNAGLNKQLPAASRASASRLAMCWHILRTSMIGARLWRLWCRVRKPNFPRPRPWQWFCVRSVRWGPLRTSTNWRSHPSYSRRS